MAVVNLWGTGFSVSVPVPVPHFSPFSSSSSSSSSSFDFCFLNQSAKMRFVLGRGGAVPRNQFLKCRTNSNISCHCSANYSDDNTNSSSNSSLDWDWNRWTRHFSEIEQAESFSSLLKFELEDAIEREDFQEAAKLKKAIAEATMKDTVAEIMSQMKTAIDEECYHDASQLCRSTGSGLVGWWAGCSKDSDDPFGRLIRITPAVGRFVARSYSPRQLATPSPGTPLFEMFVVKNADGTHSKQVVFLQHVKGSSKNTTSSPSTKGPSSSEIEDESVDGIKRNKTNAEKSEDRTINVEGATEEGIASVLNFLKEKIPQLKFEASNIDVAEEVEEDTDGVKQLMEEGDEDATHVADSDDEASSLDDNLGEGNDARGDAKNLSAKVFIGGILHNEEDTSTKDDYVRQPAEIKDMERDSFVLHIPARSQYPDSKESISAIEAKAVSELMPPDVGKAFWGSSLIPSKLSKDVREIVKHAVTRALKRYRLSEYTSFSRITTAEGDFDPFDGLYVGAFGPFGAEVVQLRRKYGTWNSKDDVEKSSDIEFSEYVEAVKLTGDLNVPARQVIFRAKIGKGNRIPNKGLYPDELGVIASYKGRGRVAEYGFRNPKWVESELLQLSGKGMGQYVKGADLGLLYVVPKQSFLVLFNRLKLPE